MRHPGCDGGYDARASLADPWDRNDFRRIAGMGPKVRSALSCLHGSVRIGWQPHRVLFHVDGAVQARRHRHGRDVLQQPLLRPATCGRGRGGANRIRAVGQTGQTNKTCEVRDVSEIAAIAAGTATRAIAVALSALRQFPSREIRALRGHRRSEPGGERVEDWRLPSGYFRERARMMLWTAPTLRHRSAIGWLR